METNRTLYEIEIALAKSRHFDFTKNIVVFNINGVSCKLPIFHECDMLVLSKSGYLTEIEIKRSWSDFLEDFNKKHSHESMGLIKYFYYCIPESLLKKAYDKLEEKNRNYSGIITYDEDLKIKLHGHRDRVKVNLEGAYSYRFITNKTYRKLYLEEQLEVARLGTIKVIKLKEKISKSSQNNNNICGNCDAFCECSLGNNGAKHDDPACEYFDDTILKQLK
jgi:hypothetical protein|nr:MAG TPA: DNA repair protein MmcB-like protein [Caudoviricetes sp.]